MENKTSSDQPALKPEILAPAGDAACFLAALAAGADGIYVGLKNFSARMQAQNFGLGELRRLIELAHENSCKVYVAMNNMLKQNELPQAWRLVKRLQEQVKPDGLIIQDLAFIDMARQAGFQGSLALSTLANVSDPQGLRTAKNLGASRVIIPRELSVDEMKIMGENCPEGLELECFVHGALCYCVSGRCYWSSYMGGKSGLRGRCVQPCRRKYNITHKKGAAANTQARYFACQDLELAPVFRALLQVPHLASWKIEGRKKGPHYVFHTVTAYKILRDNAEDTQKRKMALEILEFALGRPGVRARFLPQKLSQPMAPHGQTSSGLLAGKISFSQNGECVLKPHFPLQNRDLLRIGVEDEAWHHIQPVTRSIPKAGIMQLKLPKHKTPKAGTPVYLIDRRDSDLGKLLEKWQKKLDKIPESHISDIEEKLRFPKIAKKNLAIPDMAVVEQLKNGKSPLIPQLSRRQATGIWLGRKCLQISRTLYKNIYFWLPPALWPDTYLSSQTLISQLMRNGARNFVCNAPWQRGIFPEKLPENCQLLAGPFCNIANSLAIHELAELGFQGCIISAELSREDILKLPEASPLPLGIVLGGYYPVGLSRFGLIGMESGDIVASPKKEEFWTRTRANLTWVFPLWSLNLSGKKQELEKAGYKFFIWLEETPPEKTVPSRPGLFNWDGQLL